MEMAPSPALEPPGEGVKVSFYLHRIQKIGNLRKIFEQNVRVEIPQVKYDLVDGYSSQINPHLPRINPS